MIVALLLLPLLCFFIFIASNRPYRWFMVYTVRQAFSSEKRKVSETSDSLSEEEKKNNYQLSYANAEEPLPLKSYMHNSQNIHPKVLYIENGFGGHRFWMAYTPYPWYIDRFENPCVAYSDDGYAWTNIKGNPVDDPHGDGYDSDTHLVYREDLGILECWYRYVSDTGKPPVSEILCRRTSKDGITWSDEEVMLENNDGNYALFVSPAVIWNGSYYDMWVIRHVYDVNTIIQYRFNEDKTFTEVSEYDLQFTDENSTLHKPWHLDVIKDDDQYVFLVMCKQISGPKEWTLFLTESEDCTHFSLPHMVVHGSENGWDNDLYRSSIVKVGNEYRIYYSAMSHDGVHGIGITVSDHLSDFIGADVYNHN